MSAAKPAAASALPVGAVHVGTAKVVVGILASVAQDQSIASLAVPAIAGAIGGPLGMIIARFGYEAFGSVLKTWSGDTITEQQVADDLASKGKRVDPYDPGSLFS